MGRLILRGFAASVSEYASRSAATTAFCGDVNPDPDGLCKLSLSYSIAWDSGNRTMDLVPLAADMQIAVDLPFSNPSINETHLCPAAPKDVNDHREKKNYNLVCNDLTCVLHLINPFHGQLLRLRVEVQHQVPSCSYSFPVNLHSRNAFRFGEVALTLKTCVGNFSVRVYSGPQLCFAQLSSRTELPPIQELASYILDSVTYETQDILASYQRLVDALAETTTKHDSVKQNFSQFLNFTDTLVLQQMGFNISQWSVELNNTDVTPMNMTELMAMNFTIQLNLQNYTIAQSDFSQILKNKSREVDIYQKKVAADVDRIRQYSMFGFLPNNMAGFVIVFLFIIGACLAYLACKSCTPMGFLM